MKTVERYLTATGIVLLATVILGASLVIADEKPKPPSELSFSAREDAAPLSSRRNGQWTGYTIDLCRRIFERYQQEYHRRWPEAEEPGASDPNNLQLDFLPVFAAERIDALVNGRADVLCGATTVTVSRMRRVDFTLLTFVSGTGIMKKAHTDSSFLANPGRSEESAPAMVYVGCTEGMTYPDCTTTDTWLTTRFGSSVRREPRATFEEAFEALRKDEADFLVGDRVILAAMLNRAEDSADFVLAPAFLSYEPYAIAIAKGNDMLLDVANSVLAELYRSIGEESGIDEIYNNYFSTQKSDLLKAMYRLQALPE